MGVVIECKAVIKRYGRQEALKGISLRLEENKIYGLLGRNGAGKSTLLHILCNQSIKDGGEVFVFGEELFENAKVLEEICLVREKELPLEDYKVGRIFEIARHLYKNWDEEYKDFLVKEFKVHTKKKYKALSRGMKSIIGIIIGLASRAKITIFDEPSLGLDAAARDRFYSILLQDYEKNPRTILFSTHLIDEVSNVFEEIIVLDEGKLLLQENLNELLDRSYFVKGKEEEILPLIQGKKILHKEFFGSTAIFAILGAFDEREYKVLNNRQIEISTIPLQKLFIFLTEESQGEEENIWKQ